MRPPLLLLLAAPLFAQFYVKNNDTVVFYGDSITNQRMYSAATETFIITRFPELNVRFVHSGWGGDTVHGGGGGNIETRLKRDVLAYQPTVMTIMLGMNDGGYRAFDEGYFKSHSEGYRKILSILKAEAPNLRLTLLQPSPYDDVTQPPTFQPGYNQTLLRFATVPKELAAVNGHATADLNTGVVEMLRRAHASDPKNARQIIPDRIHPAWAGHLIMAGELLLAWNAPKVVTSVELDLGAKKIESQQNTQVSGLRLDGGTYSWTQKDNALPMPIPDKSAVTQLAIKSWDFYEKLNTQWLKLAGLDSSKKWTLRINGTRIGDFSAADLAAGLNLAKLDTPMMQQAEQVHGLTIKRIDVHHIRLRQLQLPMEKDGLPRLSSILMQLDALDEEIAARQRSTAKPGAFYYEVSGN